MKRPSSHSAPGTQPVGNHLLLSTVYPPSDDYSNLPPELHHYIAQYLEEKDIRNLCCVSHRFHDVFARSLLAKDLDRFVKNETVLYGYDFRPDEDVEACLTDAEQESSAWHDMYERNISLAPFVIRKVEYSPNEGPITLHIYKPVFFRLCRNVTLDISIKTGGLARLVHSDDLGCDSEDWNREFSAEQKARFTTVTYDDLVGNGWVLDWLTATILKANFVCPACAGEMEGCLVCNE